MKSVIRIMLILIVAGCAVTGSRMNRVSLGMSKEQVIDILGTPDSTKAMNPTEILVYTETERPFMAPARYMEYWVALKEGKVYFYGRPGDFGSAQAPTQHVIIDKTETVRQGN